MYVLVALFLGIHSGPPKVTGSLNHGTLKATIRYDGGLAVRFPPHKIMDKWTVKFGVAGCTEGCRANLIYILLGPYN
jgi:hypothetical protein